LKFLRRPVFYGTANVGYYHAMAAETEKISVSSVKGQKQKCRAENFYIL
jgi:hypothetical protein